MKPVGIHQRMPARLNDSHILHADAPQMEADARNICVNAKTNYPGGAVCNAVEKLLFHKDAAGALLGKICDDLAAKGVTPEALERVRAPVGIDIGSQTVPEIAVSIVAELIARRNLGSGRGVGG